MTRQPDFSGVRIKVERAKEHFRDLCARYESFRQAKPYETIAYDEPDTGDLVHEVKVFSQPPLYWSAIAGDTVHNLRSSLDLLVCEMVRAEGNEVTPDTGFPIFRSARACANEFKIGPPGKIKGAPQSAVDIIKRSKPYQGANNPFWRLHQLDVADKHSLLVPVGAVHVSYIFDINRALAANPDLLSKLADTEVPLTRPAGIITPEQPFSLEDGAEIYRVPAYLRDDPQAQVHMYPQFGIEVAFGEVEVAEGEPVIPALHELIQFTEGFIELFPPLFKQGITS